MRITIHRYRRYLGKGDTKRARAALLQLYLTEVCLKVCLKVCLGLDPTSAPHCYGAFAVSDLRC